MIDVINEYILHVHEDGIINEPFYYASSSSPFANVNIGTTLNVMDDDWHPNVKYIIKEIEVSFFKSCQRTHVIVTRK